LLDGLFDNALFGLFELAFNVAVVFLCLGPRELDKEVDNYLDAIDIGDSQQQFTSASQLTREAPAVELGNQVVQVCKSIFVEANTRLYAVLFWFVLLGPVAVLAYRMIEQLLHACIMVHLSNLYRSLLGWIEWIPVHLTLFVYMISGSFEDGLEAFRKGTVSAVTLYEQNHELLQQVGYRAISPHDVLNQNHAMEMVRKSRGLVLRSLIVWLLFLLVLLLLG
jgi:membrane protein required for beta-lactamase induction